MRGWAIVPLLLLIAATEARSASRSLRDSDGDGLPDAWERHGVTVQTDAGPRFIDLPAMGADPTRPDIFLQVDWMADAEHDQRPSPEAIELLVDAFARAPYLSPTGSTGIALHVDAGPDSVLEPGVTWGRLSRARVLPWQKNLGTAASGTYDWSAFEAIENAPGGFVETGRAPIFHYAIFGAFHDLDDPHGWGASGNSRGIGGTEIVVTLGNFTNGVGSPREQAGTLMHELGHNLGLRHGGCDDSNLKPGYSSVMNYAYQMEGVTRGGLHGVLDFSRGREPVLDGGLVVPPPALLSASRLERPASTRACVAPDAARAGLAVKAATAPDHGDDGCTDGEAFDDWKAIRLDLIGATRDLVSGRVRSGRECVGSPCPAHAVPRPAKPARQTLARPMP
jgi:hypothetical protein